LTKKQLVERMEANGDDWATWQWKPRKLVSAPFSRLRSRRVRRHPVAMAARLAARLALAAARSAASCAAASATKAALKHGLIAAPRQNIPNAIKWGPQVAGCAGVNQVTRTIVRAARRGVRRAGWWDLLGKVSARPLPGKRRWRDSNGVRPERHGGRPLALSSEVGGRAGWTSSSRPPEQPGWDTQDS
jgi:hypothetical protein